MIMGHTNPDMDAIGSCMGIYRLAKALDKDAYIVYDKNVTQIENFLKSIEKDSEYEDIMINKARGTILAIVPIKLMAVACFIPFKTR